MKCVGVGRSRGLGLSAPAADLNEYHRCFENFAWKTNLTSSKPDPIQKWQLDPYRLHRIALLPTNDRLTKETILRACEELNQEDRKEIIALILHQNLACFWLETLPAHPGLPFTPADREVLRMQCFRHATRYLAQKKTLLEIDTVFSAAEIAYAVFKGALTREVVYVDPAFRPSADIDILISPADKSRAVTTLCRTGYTLSANRENVSNEVTLTKDNVHLDLHWHIMRPGRPRMNMTELYLQSRQRYDYFWGLDRESALLVLLTHPVFTEYSTGPGSSVLKLADLGMWIEKQEIDWQRALHLLEISGMKTAAWITATLLASLTEWRLPASIYQALQPGRLKSLALGKWLDCNLSARFINHPYLPKYLFTLLAHDCFRDRVHFIRTFLRERRQQDAVMRQLLQAASGQ